MQSKGTSCLVLDSVFKDRCTANRLGGEFLSPELGAGWFTGQQNNVPSEVNFISLHPNRKDLGLLNSTFLSCDQSRHKRSILLGPFTLVPPDWGGWGQPMGNEEQTACFAASHKQLLVSDPGVGCVLPASMQLWQASLLASKWNLVPHRVTSPLLKILREPTKHPPYQY